MGWVVYAFITPQYWRRTLQPGIWIAMQFDVGIYFLLIRCRDPSYLPYLLILKVIDETTHPHVYSSNLYHAFQCYQRSFL